MAAKFNAFRQEDSDKKKLRYLLFLRRVAQITFHLKNSSQVTHIW